MLNILYTKMLGTRNVLNSWFVWSLEYLHIDKLSWGWYPSPNRKFIHVLSMGNLCNFHGIPMTQMWLPPGPKKELFFFAINDFQSRQRQYCQLASHYDGYAGKRYHYPWCISPRVAYLCFSVMVLRLSPLGTSCTPGSAPLPETHMFQLLL